MDEPRWLSESEARTWRGFWEMTRGLTTVMERQLAESGLSLADYELLVPLSEAAGSVLRARDLGCAARWDRSRLSHQLGRMERRGLIRRFGCPTDARGTMVELSPAGRRAIEAAAPGHVATVRRYFVDLLSRPEMRMLAEVSDRVRGELEQAAGDPRPQCR
ncbi:MAG: MarR family winged helix-turn-helix transcriptional regulator [Acidimicrobiales bacterium]